MAPLSLLRFSTAGSVDDGKSTLIGRLLYDAKSIFEDQLRTLAKTTAKRGGIGGNIGVDLPLDLALLTDGLIAEREQGITIDVAYRYFATPVRKFIIADTPGHEQYTRNMVTGASTADLTIVLVDAGKGLSTQSRRHAVIAALLGIRHVVVAMNKMDLAGWSEARFVALREEFEAVASQVGIASLYFVPVSALHGDMVVERGTHMDWYQGPTLLEILESADVDDVPTKPFRFPVQLVSRPGLDGRYVRGYMGRVESGTVHRGDTVVVAASAQQARVLDIVTLDGNAASACAPQSVTLLLDREIDISRGDMISHATAPPRLVKQFAAMVCWMDQQPLDTSRRYLIKQTTRTTRAMVESLQYRLDVDTLSAGVTNMETLHANEIGRVHFKVRDALAVDAYGAVRETGGFILIDELTNHTVAAGMIDADVGALRQEALDA